MMLVMQHIVRLHWFHKGDPAGYCDAIEDTEETAHAYAKIRSGQITGEIEVIRPGSTGDPAARVIATYVEGISYSA
jgi:hypothetical protein